MNKLYIIFLGISISISGLAQTEKGRMTFGANVISVNYRTSKTKGSDSKTTQFQYSISPSIGFFFINGLQVGLSLNNSHIESTYKSSGFDTDHYSTDSYGVGPFVEYYFGSFSRGKPFLNLNPFYSYAKSKSDFFGSINGGTSRTTSNTMQATLTGGYALFLNDSFIIKFQGGYSYNLNENNYDIGTNGTGKSNTNTTGLFIGVGILATFKRD